jgi:L-iditol 2-dehydrogenase
LQKLAHGEERLVLARGPGAEPRPGHVVLDVAAAGICGTDLHIMKDEYRSEPPVTLGHEVAGTIAALGEGVSGLAGRAARGDRDLLLVCGRCEPAAPAGRTCAPSAARSARSRTAASRSGCWCRPPTSTRCPTRLGFPEAALIEPLACVVRGLLEMNDVLAGDRAVITGPGPIGLLALQVAKASGAQSGDARHRRGRRPAWSWRVELGADGVLTVEATTSSRRGRQRDARRGSRRRDRVLRRRARRMACCCAWSKKAGRFIQVGLYGQPHRLDMDQICYKELRVSGSFATTPSSWYRALALAGSGAVPLAAVVGAVYPLREWQLAFQAVADRTPGKVLLVP